MNYRYYSLKPLSIGKYPMNNLKNFVSYANPKYISTINHEVYGEITYTKRLKNSEEYDLLEDIK